MKFINFNKFTDFCREFTYHLHLEAVNLLIVLLSVHLFSQQPTEKSIIFRWESWFWYISMRFRKFFSFFFFWNLNWFSNEIFSFFFFSSRRSPNHFLIGLERCITTRMQIHWWVHCCILLAEWSKSHQQCSVSMRAVRWYLVWPNLYCQYSHFANHIRIFSVQMTSRWHSKSITHWPIKVYC